MTRIVWLAALSLLAAPCMAQTAKLEKPRIALSVGGSISQMNKIAYFVALNKKYFEQEGLTVDSTAFASGTAALQNLVGGNADVVEGSFEHTLRMQTKGINLMCIAVFGRYPANVLVVRKSQADKIKTIADLKGKKVGINAFGSAVDLVLRVVLKKNGLDPRRDVQIVEIAFPNMAPAIREKRVDCGVLVIPFLAAEAPKGDLRPLFTGGDAFGPSSVIFQVTNNAFLKANEAAVRGFLADYVDGLAWYSDPANRTKAIELIADFTKSPKAVLDSYFATPRDYFRDPNGCVSAATIQKPIDAMFEEKLIDQRVDASKYLNLGLLPKPCAM